MKRFSILLTAVIVAITFNNCTDDAEEAPLLLDEPVAAFTFELDESNPLIVEFTNTSTDAASSSWEFGDGNTSVDTNPTHTYEAPGSYDVKLTVVNESGSNNTTESVEALDIVLANIGGEWMLAPEEAALAVGPTYASADWWFSTVDDITLRGCQFDDVYTFGTDGSYTINLDNETWVEGWQGVTAEGCNIPVVPHDGSGSFTYEVVEGKLKLIGTGAFIALPKAVNAGELPNVDIPNDVTYTIDQFEIDGDTKKMKLVIETGSGVFWTFKLVSK